MLKSRENRLFLDLTRVTLEESDSYITTHCIKLYCYHFYAVVDEGLTHIQFKTQFIKEYSTVYLLFTILSLTLSCHRNNTAVVTEKKVQKHCSKQISLSFLSSMQCFPKLTLLDTPFFDVFVRIFLEEILRILQRCSLLAVSPPRYSA